MNKRSYSEAGRSLLETLSVLVVMAILLLASIVGYRAVLHHWKKQETVKQVAELAIRYRLRPITAKDEKSKKVEIKPIYPEAERADTYTIRTSDDGRVSLVVENEPTSFMIKVDQVWDDSCEGILNSEGYDAVLVDRNLAELLNLPLVAQTEELAVGSQTLKNLDKEKRAKIIKAICSGENGRVSSTSLVFGNKCPKMGTTYWYGGYCHKCAQNQKEDKKGVCCSTLNDCGYCQGPGFLYCVQDPKGCPNLVCDGGDNGTHGCLECLESEHCSCQEGKADYTCSKGHCCPNGMEWQGGRCVCKTGGERCGSMCCGDKQSCVVNADDKTLTACCDNDGSEGSSCESDNCCDSGNCSNGYCCPMGRFWDTTKGYCVGCLGNYGSKSGGDCPAELPWCDVSDKGAVCKECPEGTFWNNVTHTCTECLANYGSGQTGACGTKDNPLCDNAGENPMWTCGPCPSETIWDDVKHACVCPGTKPIWDGTKCVECLQDEDCSETTCNTTNHTCCSKDMPYWNGSSCGKCLYHYQEDDKTADEGACPIGAPNCDKNGTWTCTSCPEDKPYWNGTACVCRYNYQEDGKTAAEGACPQDTPLCDKVGTKTCTTCPEEKFWNDMTHSCTECLVDFEQGVGACQTREKPLCPTTGENAYTCQACPSEKPHWDGEKCVAKICPATRPATEGATCTYNADENCCDDSKGLSCSSAGKCECPSDTPYWNKKACVECLANYGSGEAGACGTPEKPLCPTSGENAYTCQACPSDTPHWYSNLGRCIECIGDYGRGERPACQTEAKPWCDSAGVMGKLTYRCQTCAEHSSTSPYWNGKTCSECLANYGSGQTGACQTVDKPLCRLTSSVIGNMSCQACPADTPYWDGKACVECLANYGSGKTGACQTPEKPWCPTSGENAYTCQACPSDKPNWNGTECVACTGGQVWDTSTKECKCPPEKPRWAGRSCVSCFGGMEWDPITEECKCPSDKPYWTGSKCAACLTDYGSGKEGACPTISAPKCDNVGTNPTGTCVACQNSYWNGTKCATCPDDRPWWDATDGTCKCKANHGGGTGACPTESKPLCNPVTFVCQKCGDGSWDSDAKACCKKCNGGNSFVGGGRRWCHLLRKIRKCRQWQGEKSNKKCLRYEDDTERYYTETCPHEGGRSK